MILNLELLDDHIALLKLLLYNFEFLRISERILRLDDFFKVSAQATALVHVAFYFELGFVGACVFYVALE